MYESIKLIGTRELMNILKIGKDRAYALMQSEEFPSVKIGAMYYVTEENLKKWLNESAHKTIRIRYL